MILPIRLLRSFRFETAFRFGEYCGDLGYHLAGPQRRVALANLQIAFPEKSDLERRAIAREAFRNFGRTVAEFVHMRNLTAANIAERITFADPQSWNADQLTLGGKHVAGTTGILVLTGHLGNWELFAQVMGLLGKPIHLVYRPFRNPSFNDFVNKERQRAGTRLISKRRAAREAMKVLRDKGMVAVPFDQNATGRWGVFADFFGVPASTHPGLARFAKMSRAPVCPAFLIRQNGTWNHKVLFLPEIEVTYTGDRDRDTAENLTRFNLVFEEVVRRYPEQWIWVHKRWRTRPPGEPPLYV